MKSIQEIVNKCLTEKNYYVNEILNLPNNFLKIKIENNVPYIIGCEKLPNGDIEERQSSIFKMISDLCLIKDRWRYFFLFFLLMVSIELFRSKLYKALLHHHETTVRIEKL
jgi:hypothetical protein